MTMELLPEPLDTVPNDAAHAADTTSAVDKDLLKEKEPPKRQKSTQPAASLHRLAQSIDPLFYATFMLSMMVLVGGLFAVHRYNEKLVEGYLGELHAANQEFRQRTGAGSKTILESSVSSSSLQNNYLSQMQTVEDPVVLPQSVEDAEAAAEVLSADPDMSGELAELKKLLQEKTQQIEFLSLENHELRLQAEFGSPGSEVQIVDHEEISERENTLSEVSIAPLDTSLLSEATLLSEVAVPRSKSSDVDVQQFIANGFEAYSVKNFPVANEWYSQALQIDPINHDANHGVAATAAVLGNHELASDRYRHLLSINPDDQQAFSEMLKLATTDNLIETELLSHIDVSKNPAPLYSIAGHYLGKQGRWVRARDMYEKALEGHSETTIPADYFFNLAVSYEHLGYRAIAAEHYLQAINSPYGATFDREIAVRQLELLAVPNPE